MLAGHGLSRARLEIHAALGVMQKSQDSDKNGKQHTDRKKI